MAKATFEDLLTHLTGDQTPRVWSLLVTVFGELAQDEGAQIKGTVLSRLCNLMGIKPEAMRVALHRLRKDGWIQSERSGRTSSYALTDWGRTQSAAATPRIYGHEPLPQEAWLVLFDPGRPVDDHQTDGVWIAANMLVTTTRPAQAQTFASEIVPDQPLPMWMTNRICPSDLVQTMQDTLNRMAQVQNGVDNSGALDCFEVSAIRILIVDRWRRVVLKTPLLPAHVFPETWTGQDCRTTVVSLLETYEKQGLDALEAAL